MKRLFIAFSLLITLLCISTETEAQTQRTRTYLHGRFETGDYPTQTDYRDVFATFFSRLEDSLSISVLYGVDTISNDVTLADSSTVALVTEAAVKGYVDAAAGSVTNGDKGDITVASGNWTINNDAVDADAIATGAVGTSEIANNSVANADLATMATNTLKGNDSGGSATPQDLTVAEAKTMLAIASTDVTDFEEAVEDLVGANIVAGSGVSVAYDDGTGNTTITSTSLADGDKGDIDVSGSGTTWTIDTSAVTTLEILDATIAWTDLSSAVQDSIGTGGGSGIDSTTASNGLTLTGVDVAIGGTLSQNTTITGAGYDLLIPGIDSTYLDVDGIRIDIDSEKLLTFPGTPGANPVNTNMFFGPGAGASAVNSNTGYANTGIGNGALAALTLDDSGGGTQLSRSNVALGYNAGATITTGAYNVFLGTSAGGAAPTTSALNTGVGQHALQNTTGNENTVMGANAGGAVASGNSIFGASSVLTGTGSNNSYFGYKSGENATSGSRNAAFGYLTLRNTQTSDQVAIGNSALETATTATENTAIGAYAGENLTTSVRNVYIGYESGQNQLTGGNNIGIGASTFKDATASLQSVGIGNFVLTVNAGSLNTAVGYVSQRYNTSGTRNTSLGALTLGANTTGSDNTGFGYESGGANTTGIRNTYLGANSGKNNIVGDNNTSVGYAALGSVKTGTNVAIGSNSSGNITTAVGVTSLGYLSGRYANRDYNISIGYNANGNIADSTISNVIVIGKDARPTANNQITLGDSNGSYTQMKSRNFVFDIDASLSTGNILAWNGSEFSPANTSAGLDANYFKQNGNSFGTSATLGTNDANILNFETNNTNRISFDSGGKITSGTLTDIQLTASDSVTLNASGSGLSMNGSFTRLYDGSNIPFQVNNSTQAVAFNVADNNASAFSASVQGGSQFFLHDSTDGAEVTTVGSGASGSTIQAAAPFIAKSYTHTEAGALTPVNGMIIYVSSTDATFTSIGIWAYENGAWAKL